MKLKEIYSVFNEFASFNYQEEYDNAGIITGHPDHVVKGILCCIDVNEEIMAEAKELGTDLIVCHHPVIFGGLKRITGQSIAERVVIDAVKNNICILAVHTNIDNISEGVNKRICDYIGLKECSILEEKRDQLVKLVTFVPEGHAAVVREAIFNAGAGKIGNYDYCSYNLTGEGTFRGSENTNPFVGEKGKIHFEKEIRIETIVPKVLARKVVIAMLKAHPYEEVAYDLYPLINEYNKIGSGMIGELDKPAQQNEFLKLLKEKFGTECIKYCGNKKSIKKVAVCGGSGSFLINAAIRLNADILVTSDIKYHQFFDNNDRIMLADIGHYESEQFTKEIFYDLLKEKLPTFAVHLSKVNTNPIKYY